MKSGAEIYPILPKIYSLFSRLSRSVKHGRKPAYIEAVVSTDTGHMWSALSRIDPQDHLIRYCVSLPMSLSPPVLYDRFIKPLSVVLGTHNLVLPGATFVEEISGRLCTVEVEIIVLGNHERELLEIIRNSLRQQRAPSTTRIQLTRPTSKSVYLGA